MKHYHWLPVTSPMVEIECGGVIQRSHHIKNANKNPNFQESVISFDVVRYLLIKYDMALLAVSLYYSIYPKKSCIALL